MIVRAVVANASCFAAAIAQFVQIGAIRGLVHLSFGGFSFVFRFAVFDPAFVHQMRSA